MFSKFSEQKVISITISKVLWRISKWPNPFQRTLQDSRRLSTVPDGIEVITVRVYNRL